MPDHLSKYFLLLFSIISCICMGRAYAVTKSQPAEINTGLSEGLYRIESLSDGLHLTVEGGKNKSFAGVVGEIYQNFAEQRWQLKKTGSLFQILPERYTMNNILTYVKEDTQKYASPVFWKFVEQKKNEYQLENAVTKNCLNNHGRRLEVTQVPCDKFAKSQKWKFYKLR